MSSAEFVTVTCDLCGKQVEHVEKGKRQTKPISYPVYFMYSESDGYTKSPHVSNIDLDICDECRDKVLMVLGYGAYGKYEFEKRWEVGDE